jgi:uncharacterized protein YueI
VSHIHEQKEQDAEHAMRDDRYTKLFLNILFNYDRYVKSALEDSIYSLLAMI